MRLAVVVVAIIAALAYAAASTHAARPTCIVPRLYTLSIASATSRLFASGCSLGETAYERPRGNLARVTGQVPPPGAILPTDAHVSIIVS